MRDRGCMISYLLYESLKCLEIWPEMYIKGPLSGIILTVYGKRLKEILHTYSITHTRHSLKMARKCRNGQTCLELGRCIVDE